MFNFYFQARYNFYYKIRCTKLKVRASNIYNILYLFFQYINTKSTLSSLENVLIHFLKFIYIPHYNDNSNDIPEAFSPYRCTSDMKHNHTHFHELEEKTYNQNFQYPTISENTEIQLTPVDQCCQDQTPPSPSVTSLI